MQKSDDAKRPTAELDIQAQAMLARLTGSVSPQSIALAWLDWASHLATSPGKLTELTQLAMEQANALGNYARESMVATSRRALSADSEMPAPPLPDRRFKDPLW